MLGFRSILCAAMVGLGCGNVCSAQSTDPLQADAPTTPVISHVEVARKPNTVDSVREGLRESATLQEAASISVPDSTDLIESPTVPLLDDNFVGGTQSIVGEVTESDESEGIAGVSPLGDLLGFGDCCGQAPWPGFGVTYVTGTVPYHLFNVGAGASLTRSQATTSILPLRVGASPTQVLLPLPGDNGPLGAVRITDNNSAIPRDRIFLDYSRFHNVDASRQYHSHRATFGIEKRWVDPVYSTATSFDLRIPFGLTLAPGAEFGPNSDSDSSELGNFLIGVKSQIWTGSGYGVSVGLAGTIPTADDVSIREPGMPATAIIENKTIHVTPYIAATWMPAPYTSAHLFYSIDFDVNGSPVFMDTNLDGLIDVTGNYTSATMHSLDLSFISWLFRDDFAPTGLSGAAWYTEFHYSGSLQTPDSIVSGPFRIGNSNSNIDMFNIAFGSHLQFANDKLLTIGYALPLKTTESVYDGELRVMFNKYF